MKTMKRSFPWLLYLVLELTLIYVWVDLATDLLFTGVLGLSYFILAIAAAVFLIKAIWKKRAVHLIHSCAIVVVIFSTGFIASQIVASMRVNSIQKAEVIIKKIEDFREEHGRYPDEIGSNIGLDNEAVETGMGWFTTTTYRYKAFEERYSLSFSEPAFMVSTFDPKTGSWVKHD